MAETIATWTIELNCDCPLCEKAVDLLDYADFWDGRGPYLDIAEHDTDRSRDVDVTCPECGCGFVVDLEY